MTEALIWILFACLVAHASLSLQVNVNDEPSFVMTANEVTTVEGETAVLPCSILNLNDHKVAWTNKRSALLTMLDRRIIDDKRISLEQPTRNDWNIHIRNVLVSDEGRYTCHINTYPVKTHQVTLTVKGRWRRKEDEKLTDRPLTVSNETIVVEIQEYILKVNVNDEASFVMTASEVITVEGETAVLPCSILNLNDHKVVWIDKMSTLLTFQDRMIIDDKRISLKRPTPNDWNIHISDVQVSDEGRYSCQINTNPVKTHQVTLTVKVNVNDEPSFVMTANEVTTVEGETAVLPCSILNLNDHKVAWTNEWSTLLTWEDRRNIDDKRISIEQPTRNDWNIHISNVQKYDEGRYSCKINTNPVKTHQVSLTVKESINQDNDKTVTAKTSNEGLFSTTTHPGTKTVGTQTLDIHGPPIFQAASKYEVVTEGDYVQLWCNFTGKPKPTIAWFREDKRSRLRKQVGDENLLEMVDVTREEDGRYECVADNGIPPTVTKIMYIGVNYPPRIMAASKYEVIGEGTNVKLWCNVTSRPKSRITWFKKDESTKLRKQVGNGSMLELFHVTREEDGRYECVVENDIPPSAMKIMYVNVMYDDEQITATDSSKGQLITTANPEIEMFGTQTLAINGPPKALAASNYELVEEGSNVKLWCNVTGLPIPTITWFREDKNTKIRKRDQVGHGNLLEMVHVTREEDGRYRCVADNGIPPEVTKIMDLVVTYPPRIIAASRYKVVGEGANVKLWCNVTGRPTASVTWYKVDESTKTRKKRGYGNVLELLSVTREEDGRYECVAENGIAPNVMKILYIRIIYEEKTIKATTSSKGQFITTANPDKEMFESNNQENGTTLTVTTSNEGILSSTTNRGKITVGKHTLDVNGPPIFLAASKYEVVTEGDYVQLWCNFTGNPKPSIAWFREDKRSRLRKQVGDGNLLEMANVTREEDGRYECVADNGIAPTVTKIMYIGVNYPPRILVASKYEVVEEGNNVQLWCNVTSRPKSRTTWFKKDERTKLKTQIGNGSMLKLFHVTREEDGRYECVVENEIPPSAMKIMYVRVIYKDEIITATDSSKGQLNTTANPEIEMFSTQTLAINGPPKALAASNYELVKEGSNVQLWCNVTGLPIPTITWFREDKNTKIRKLDQVGHGNLLEMVQVTREEGGRYRCVADNGIPPEVTKIMYLVVTYPPRIIAASRYIVVGEGANVKLWCNVTGRPTASVTWYKVDESTKTKKKLGYGNVLELLSVTREADGSYECVAENGIAPNVMKILYIRIIYEEKTITATTSSKGQFITTANPDKEMFGPPRFLAASKYEVVREGKYVKLWCNFTGLPTPTITWFREDKTTRERKYVGDGNVLEMFNVTREEDGGYECVADNGIPPHISRIMFVSVKYKPEVSKIAIALSPTPEQIRILECQVVASPIKTILWKKDGRELTTNEKYRLELVRKSRYSRLLRLSISDIKKYDFGVYTCFANNKFGTDQANITLKDKDDDNEVNNDCENDCADEDAIDNDNDKDDDDEVNYDCENDCADENAIDNDNDKDDDNEVDDDCENDCVDEDAIDNENVDNDFVDDGDDDDLDNDVDALIDVDDADSYAYFEDAVDNY